MHSSSACLFLLLWASLTSNQPASVVVARASLSAVSSSSSSTTSCSRRKATAFIDSVLVTTKQQQQQHQQVVHCCNGLIRPCGRCNYSIRRETRSWPSLKLSNAAVDGADHLTLSQTSSSNAGGNHAWRNMRMAIARTERGQKLRVLQWMKQVRSDLTSAEFVLNLEVGSPSRGGASSDAVKNASTMRKNGTRVNRSIDYDRLARTLQGDLGLLERKGVLVDTLRGVLSNEEISDLTYRLKNTLDGISSARRAMEAQEEGKKKKVTEKKGEKKADKGTATSAAATPRPMSTAATKAAAPVAGGIGGGASGSGSGGGSKGGAAGVEDKSPLKQAKQALEDVKVPEFGVFIREDGTVDWDGALQSGQEVARFGQELWERINGRSPEGAVEESKEGNGNNGWGAAPAKEVLEDPPSVKSLIAEEAALLSRLQVLMEEVQQAREQLREAQRKGAPSIEGRIEVRLKEDAVDDARRFLRLHSLDLDMERIYYALEVDLKDSAMTALRQQKLLVVEFGMLDAQLAQLKRLARESGLGQWRGQKQQSTMAATTTTPAGTNDAAADSIAAGEEGGVSSSFSSRFSKTMAQMPWSNGGVFNSGGSSKIEEDELKARANALDEGDVLNPAMAGAKGAAAAVIMDGLGGGEMFMLDDDEIDFVAREVTDLKQRVGIGLELQQPAFQFDADLVIRYIKETFGKIKSGLDFYVTGSKLFGQDLQYAIYLVSRAAQGYTLKPREVRTLRRTLKDIVTLVPFTIILIIPLSPIGHVLVFSFIQRFFPDFFPSTYTDRRQNLLKLFEEVEKKEDDMAVVVAAAEASGGINNFGIFDDATLENLRRNFMSTLMPSSSPPNTSSSTTTTTASSSASPTGSSHDKDSNGRDGGDSEEKESSLTADGGAGGVGEQLTTQKNNEGLK